VRSTGSRDHGRNKASRPPGRARSSCLAACGLQHLLSRYYLAVVIEDARRRAGLVAAESSCVDGHVEIGDPTS
jgi:hypothetical protein